MLMKVFVELLTKTINDKVKPLTESSNNLYVNLEAAIVERELDKLLKNYEKSEATVSVEALAPFKEFLATRWERIKNTNADYQSAPASFANLACEKLATIIARQTYLKQNVTKDQVDCYLTGGESYSGEMMQAERDERLKANVCACLRAIFRSGDELVTVLTTQIPKSEWVSFISRCDYLSLQSVFLGDGYINKHQTIYDAVTQAVSSSEVFGVDNARNEATLFCLLEIYKRQRQLDPEYTGAGTWMTGIGKARRLSQIEVLQGFILGEKTNFDEYLQTFPKDANSLYSGHTKILAEKTSRIKQADVPVSTLSVSGLK